MDKRIGLLGATSLVGGCLIEQLRERGWNVTAFSRNAEGSGAPNPRWIRLDNHHSLPDPHTKSQAIPLWVCAAPIWVLPGYLPMLEVYGAQRVVTLSSTSRFTKALSGNRAEVGIVQRLREGEEQLHAWAIAKEVDWAVLRPTLIYGHGKDKNICEIARFIRRFGFFPVFGKAMGMRQPVHAEDVAMACIAALESPLTLNRAYDLSGGESIPYREMITRVFAALGRPPRLLPIPLPVFGLALAMLRCLPYHQHWSTPMAIRMNQDLTFDHSGATRDLGYMPRAFVLRPVDLPA